MRISDWSSDVCSSDLRRRLRNCSIRKVLAEHLEQCRVSGGAAEVEAIFTDETDIAEAAHQYRSARRYAPVDTSCLLDSLAMHRFLANRGLRSEEHTSELQSLMRISYDVFCLKKKKKPHTSSLLR